MEEDSVKSLIRLVQKDEKHLIELISEKIHNDQELNSLKVKYDIDKKMMTSEIKDFKILVKSYKDKIKNMEMIVSNYENNQMLSKIKGVQEEKMNVEMSQTLKNTWNTLIHLSKNVSIQVRAEIETLIYDENDIKELFISLIGHISEDYKDFQKEISKLQKDNQQFKLLREKYQGFDSQKEDMVIRHQQEIKLIEKQKENAMEKNIQLQNQINELQGKLKSIKSENSSINQQLEAKVSSLQKKIDEKNEDIDQLKQVQTEREPSALKQYKISQEREKDLEREKQEYLMKVKQQFDEEVESLQRNNERRLNQKQYESEAIQQVLKEQIEGLRVKIVQSQQDVERMSELMKSSKSLSEKEQMLIEEMRKLEQEKQQLQLTLQSSIDNSVQLQIDNNKLETELAHQLILNQQLTSTIQDFRIKYDHTSDTTLHKHKQLEAEKSALIKQINDLNSQMVLVLEENIDRVRKEERLKRDDILAENSINHRAEINQLIQRHEQKMFDLKDQLRSQIENMQETIGNLNNHQTKMKELFQKEVAKYEEQINALKIEFQEELNKQKEEALRELEQLKQDRNNDKAVMKGENDKFRERVRKRAIEDAKKEMKEEIDKLKQLISEWEYKYNQVEEKLTNQHNNQIANLISQYDNKIVEDRRMKEKSLSGLEQSIKLLQEEKVLLTQANNQLEEKKKLLLLENAKCQESSATYKTLNEELVKNYDNLQNKTQIKSSEHEKEVEKLCNEIREVKQKVIEAYDQSCNTQLQEQQNFVKNMEKSVNELQILHKQEVKDLKEQNKELQILYNLRPSKTEDIKTIQFLKEELSNASKKISRFELEYQNMKKTYDVFKPQPQPLGQHTALHSILNNIQLNASQIIIPNTNSNLHAASAVTTTTINNHIYDINSQQARLANTPSLTQPSPFTRQNLSTAFSQNRVQSSLSNYRLNVSSTDDLIKYQQNNNSNSIQQLNSNAKEGEFLFQKDNLFAKTSSNMFRGSSQRKNKKPKRIKTEQDEETENNQNIGIGNNRNQSRIGELFKEGTFLNLSCEQLKGQADPQSPLKNNLIQQKLKVRKTGVKLTLQDAIQKKNFVAYKVKQNGQVEQENEYNYNTVGITSGINQKSISLNPRNYNNSIKRPRINTASNLIEKINIQMDKNTSFSRKTRDEQLKYLTMQRPMSSLEFQH